MSEREGARISSPKNERLRLARALATRRGRKRLGRFLLEGPKVIRELLERDPRALEQLLYSADAPDEPGDVGPPKPGE